MSKLFTVLLTFIISISNAYTIDITPVKKGEVIQEDGFFVDKTNIKEFRKINEDKKLLEQENITLTHLRVIDKDITEEYKKQYKQATRDLQWEQTKSTLKLIGGFALGAIITGLIGYGTLKYTRR